MRFIGGLNIILKISAVKKLKWGMVKKSKFNFLTFCQAGLDYFSFINFYRAWIGRYYWSDL